MYNLAKDANKKIKYKRIDYIHLIEKYTNKLEPIKEKQNAEN
jgi:hypothetical protein